jgi:hypothetical protein
LLILEILIIHWLHLPFLVVALILLQVIRASIRALALSCSSKLLGLNLSLLLQQILSVWVIHRWHLIVLLLLDLLLELHLLLQILIVLLRLRIHVLVDLVDILLVHLLSLLS